MTPRFALVLAALAASTMLVGCGADRPPPSAEDAEGETRSIFRPEFQVEPIEALESLETLETRVIFPEGAELTEEARAELATVMASPQLAEGGAIILRGHSDSGGSDESNMRASQARAEAVRDWLVAHGVAEDRITIIAFGEQNPVAPNALPDGTPDEAGRAANRRVEIEVRGKAAPASGNQPTLAESLAGAGDDGGGTKESSRDEAAQ